MSYFEAFEFSLRGTSIHRKLKLHHPEICDKHKFNDARTRTKHAVDGTLANK